jgi:hypothetical protein
MASQDNLADLASIVQRGPDRHLLEQPVYQSTGPQQPSGWMGSGGKVAMIADKFLEGVSRGRMMAFQHSEQERMNNLGAVQQAIRAVENSNISQTQKDQQLSRLNTMLGQMILTDHSVDGSKKGSGKKGGGQSSGGEDEQHPAHHILTAVRGMVSNMLGPGAQKQPVDPAQVKSTLYDVYASIADPKNSLQTQMTNIDQGVSQAYDAALKQNQGKPLSWSQMQGVPELRDAINKGIAANGGQPTPGIQSLMESGKSQESIQDPLYQAQIKHYQNEDKRYEAQGQQLLKNSKGETVRFDANEQKFYDMGGQPISGNDPRLVGLNKIGAEARQRNLRVEGLRDGRIATYDPLTNEFRGYLKGPDGRPVTKETSAGRIALQQGYVDERFDESQLEQTQRFYDTKVDKVDSSKLPESKKNAQRDKIEYQRDQALKNLRKGPKTDEPPKAGGAGSVSIDNFLNQMFGPAATTQAPPSAGASWASQ